jgi:hypothetical protein
MIELNSPLQAGTVLEMFSPAGQRFGRHQFEQVVCLLKRTKLERNFSRRLSMKSLHSISLAMRWLTVLAIAVLCMAPAAGMANTNNPAINIAIQNNASFEIRHVYLAPVGSDNWGDDQLSGAIASGQSATINATCSDTSIRVIAEDADGCFIYNTVACSGNASLTIDNSSARDCGGQ